MSKDLRRLEDRIRELCARVTASGSHDELHQILPELRNAIHQSTERLRRRAAMTLIGRSVVTSPGILKERRKS